MFSFFDPDHEEVKRIMKNARRKFEIPMPAVIRCGLQQSLAQGNLLRSVENHKTKYGCIVEADETMRIRMEGSQNKNHADHIAEKGMTSLGPYNLVHKIYSYASSNENTDANAVVEKRTGKTGEKGRHGS